MFMSTYYAPDMVLVSGETGVNDTKKSLLPTERHLKTQK